MPIDMFTTREMLPVLEQGFVPTTFLRDTFFSNVVESTTAVVDIDIVKGGQEIAPYVHPRIGGKMVERAGYVTKSYEPPEVSPERITTAEDLLNRAPGETVYSSRSPDQRAAEQLGKDLAYLDRIITRREEVQCAEALFSGQVTVIGDGYNEVVQYWPADPGEQPYTELTGAALWSATDTSDPIQDLEDASDAISAESDLAGDMAILGKDAASALLKNERVLKLLDNRRVMLGQIDPRRLPSGAKYLGDLGDISLFTYNKYYRDADGNRQPLVPTDRVLVASSGARTTMAYGAVALFRPDDAPEIVAARRVPDSWTQRKNPAGRIVQIKARPLPILNQLDAFHVIKVL